MFTTKISIVLTGNYREWRRVCTVRTTPEAHWEIRMVIMQILKTMKELAPIVFHDFVLDTGKMVAYRNDPEIRD